MPSTSIAISNDKETFLYHDKLLPGAAVRRKVASALLNIGVTDKRRGFVLFIATVACLAFVGAIATSLVGDDGGQEVFLADAEGEAVKLEGKKEELLAVAVKGSHVAEKKEFKDEHGVKIEEDTVEVMGTHIFLRRATPPAVNKDCPPVLLLHGAAYSSKLWQNFGTLSLLAHKTGCFSYAVDLPTGSADAGRLTEPANVAPHYRGDFLAALIKHLSPDSPMIVVAPSMSGSYAIPMLLQQPQLMAGFVPIAPILEMTPEEKEKLKASTMPTLAIVGEWDARGKRITENLLAPMPFSTLHVLPEARHAAYVDQPDKFHELLLDFVFRISKDRALAS